MTPAITFAFSGSSFTFFQDPFLTSTFPITEFLPYIYWYFPSAVLTGFLLFSNVCSSAIASLASVPLFTLLKAPVSHSMLSWPCVADSDGQCLGILLFISVLQYLRVAFYLMV